MILCLTLMNQTQQADCTGMSSSSIKKVYSDLAYAETQQSRFASVYIVQHDGTMIQKIQFKSTGHLTKCTDP